jgi:hypothetical protein
MLEGSFGGCAVRWPVEPLALLSLYAIAVGLYSIKKRNRDDMLNANQPSFDLMFSGTLSML